MDSHREHNPASDLYRNLRILAALTFVFLAFLAYAPAKNYFSEWRAIQNEYNARATALGMAPMSVRLHQIWRPEAGVTDRCASCHVSMGPAKALPNGGALYGTHPEVGHSIAQMGCTLCHRGQGRATTTAAAHGRIKHWEDPMLEGKHVEAGCGTCHALGANIPPAAVVEQGRYLFDLHGCNACHVVNGEGGRVGPDLSGVALKGYDRDWQVRHLREPASTVEGSRMMSFGHLSEQEVDGILAYVDTLIGAPKLVRGKALAEEIGCRGCHKISDVGGDVGPDLTDVASTPIAARDFSNVEGPKTRANWHRKHLWDPQLVVPGSEMPAVRLAPDDQDALVTYILSLRRPSVPLEQLPAPTVLAKTQGLRDFGSDGQSLYDTFCATCHGVDGEGKAIAAMGMTGPAITNSDFLGVASDEYLKAVLKNGRPGRGMPAWAGMAGGLTLGEVDTLVAWLRQHQPVAPSFDEVAAAMPFADTALGWSTMAAECSACHGLDADGSDIAPSLTSPELRLAADERYLYTTIAGGRLGTAMPAHPHFDAQRLASVIRAITDGPQGGLRPKAPAVDSRELSSYVAGVLGVSSIDAYRATGSVAYGGLLFEGMCAGCHGADAQGGLAPAIGNPSFLRAASDGFLASTIVLGRSMRPMRAFGPGGIAAINGSEVGDIITYLRTNSVQLAAGPPQPRVRGTVVSGERLFAQYCSGCHGVEGKGKSAPALNNAGFLASATDGFMQATIARGRRGTAMRAWAIGGHGFAEVPPHEINDIVAYIRSWQQR